MIEMTNVNSIDYKQEWYKVA